MYYSGIVMLPLSAWCFVLSLYFFFTDSSTIEIIDYWINPEMLFFVIFGVLGLFFIIIGLPMYITGREKKYSVI